MKRRLPHSRRDVGTKSGWTRIPGTPVCSGAGTYCYRDPAQFRRERAIAETLKVAGLNVPVLVQATPERRQDADHAPPRQLLRQDVGVQQPAPDRRALHADQAAHRGAGLRPPSAPIWTVSPPCAASSTDCASCASAPSARGPPRSTPSATARNCWSSRVSTSSRSTSPK